VTKRNNYVLENALNETIKMAYPRQKLKIVTDMESADSETREVDSILSHKTVHDKLVYEVLWKNSKLTDWLPIENFNNLEVINKYHLEIDAEVKMKKSSERLRVKSLKSLKNKKEDIGITTVLPVIKKKRGRPTKNKFVNFLRFILVLLYILSCVSAETAGSAFGNFRYCDEGQNNLLNTERTCEKLPDRVSKSQNKILNNDFNETNKFFILDKMTHRVSGIGHECKKEKITLKTFRDFFRRDSFVIKKEVLRVTKEEYFYMKQTNICVDTLMTCENNICQTDKTPLETYSWLQEISNEIINCEVTNRFITADDESSILFNNHLCVAKLGFCQFARSTVVWSMTIIHKCNFI
jgi:hypothetical protein